MACKLAAFSTSAAVAGRPGGPPRLWLSLCSGSGIATEAPPISEAQGGHGASRAEHGELSLESDSGEANRTVPRSRDLQLCGVMPSPRSHAASGVPRRLSPAGPRQVGPPRQHAPPLHRPQHPSVAQLPACRRPPPPTNSQFRGPLPPGPPARRTNNLGPPCIAVSSQEQPSQPARCDYHGSWCGRLCARARREATPDCLWPLGHPARAVRHAADVCGIVSSPPAFREAECLRVSCRVRYVPWPWAESRAP